MFCCAFLSVFELTGCRQIDSYPLVGKKRKRMTTAMEESSHISIAWEVSFQGLSNWFAMKQLNQADDYDFWNQTRSVSEFRQILLYDKASYLLYCF